MKYGAMNFPIKPVLDELEKIHDLGFDYFELSLDPPCAHYADINRQQAELMRALDTHDMEVVCHLPTFVYTADLCPDIRKISLTEMTRSIQTAARIGAKKVVLHPSIISGLGPLVLDEALFFSFHSLELLVNEADRLGVCICFENMYPRYHAFFDPDQFAKVFDKYPQLKLTLDTGHANMGDPKGSRLLEFIEKYPDRIGHVHISDNKGKYDEHLKVGDGTVDFTRFVQALKSTGYDDTITLEIFSPDTAELLDSRDQIAALL